MASRIVHARAANNREEVLAEAPDFFRVEWRQSPGLRKLYFYAAILCVASATTGYDGSMLNAMQFFPTWEEHMDHPSDVLLGRYVGTQYTCAAKSTADGPSA